MEGHLLMSRKELERKGMLTLVQSGRLSLKDAADRLGLSYRHCRRVYQRFRAQGDDGLVHRSRGRASNRQAPAALRDAVVTHYVKHLKPVGAGPTLAAEKLAEAGMPVRAETLRRWLIADNHWESRPRRDAHRDRRERRARFGELVQMDGSHHRWFGPDGRQCCLMNLVDDATGRTYSLMFEEETTEAAMRALWGWIACHGIPRALYVDRKTVYVTEREPTVEEQLADQAPLTAFGKACAKLGIQLITAYSPQAKGRVERNHGVYQDRLVKELRLQGITGLEEANALLTGGFVDGLNERFAKQPRDPRDAHMPVPRRVDLARVFCWEESRQVQNDWTIRYQNRWYQITRDNKQRPRPKHNVVVRTLLDGTMELEWHGRRLLYHEVSAAPAQTPGAAPVPKTKPANPKTNGASKARKPADNHPWKQGCTLMLNDAPAPARPKAAKP